VRRAVESGVTFFDTADMYSELVRRPGRFSDLRACQGEGHDGRLTAHAR
jgi:hypothetical protein